MDIDKVLTDTRITQHQRWYTEQKLFESAAQQGDSLSNRIDSSMTPLDLSPSWPDEFDALPNQDLLEKMKSAYSEWQNHVAGMKSGAEAKLRELLGSLGTIRGLWQTRFDQAETVYRQLLESLDTESIGLQALSERRKGMQARIHTLDGIDLKLQNELLPHIQSLKADRDAIADGASE